MTRSPTYIAAAPGDLYWRREVCPHRGAKVLLKTIGGIAWIGHWGNTAINEHFVAWCPLPKDGAPPKPIHVEPLWIRVAFAFKLIFNPGALAQKT